MPYTPKQTRYLLSDASPLTAEQKASMQAELKADPSLAHAKKKQPKKNDAESYSYNWRQHQGRPRKG